MGRSLWFNKYVIFVTFMRLTGYVYIFFNPILGIFLSMFLDVLDWFILSFGRIKREDYDRIDKPLDYIQYLFLIPILFNTPIFNFYIFLLLYRTFGYIFVRLTKNEKLFIFFPNFAEYYALAYLLINEYDINLSLYSFELFISLFLLKIFQEYWIHIKPNSYSWFIGSRLHDHFDRFREKLTQ